jgi:ElaB/YqjD/DUF883 family membrane-anchored ribosome-binding protein
MPGTDKNLTANSQKNLDHALDHAIEETFPTSDPVSVQITKGGAIEYDDAGNPSSQGSGADAPGYVAQATEALGSAASSASEMAQGAYEQGRRYAKDAAERYPQAGDYYRKSREAAQAYAPENPMLTLLLGAAIGYGMAWIIHHKGWRDDKQVPDHARTGDRYGSKHRDWPTP